MPERLRGETATFDIKDGEGNVMVEEGRRITARHIRQMEKAGVSTWKSLLNICWAAYLAERSIIDSETGELLFECNTEITEETLEAAAERRC